MRQASVRKCTIGVQVVMELGDAGARCAQLLPKLLGGSGGAAATSRRVPADDELRRMEAILAHRSGGAVPATAAAQSALGAPQGTAVEAA